MLSICGEISSPNLKLGPLSCDLPPYYGQVESPSMGSLSLLHNYVKFKMTSAFGTVSYSRDTSVCSFGSLTDMSRPITTDRDNYHPIESMLLWMCLDMSYDQISSFKGLQQTCLYRRSYHLVIRMSYGELG